MNSDPTAHLILQKSSFLSNLQDEGDGTDWEQVQNLQSEVNDLIEIEDLKWRQRAKQSWLQQGDKNSKYLHACTC